MFTKVFKHYGVNVYLEMFSNQKGGVKSILKTFCKCLNHFKTLLMFAGKSSPEGQFTFKVSHHLWQIFSTFRPSTVPIRKSAAVIVSHL